MIKRRFSEKGDMEAAMSAIRKVSNLLTHMHVPYIIPPLWGTGQ